MQVTPHDIVYDDVVWVRFCCSGSCGIASGIRIHMDGIGLVLLVRTVCSAFRRKRNRWRTWLPYVHAIRDVGPVLMIHLSARILCVDVAGDN